MWRVPSRVYVVFVLACALARCTVSSNRALLLVTRKIHRFVIYYIFKMPYLAKFNCKYIVYRPIVRNGGETGLLLFKL